MRMDGGILNSVIIIDSCLQLGPRWEGLALIEHDSKVYQRATCSPEQVWPELN